LLSDAISRLQGKSKYQEEIGEKVGTVGRVQPRPSHLHHELPSSWSLVQIMAPQSIYEVEIQRLPELRPEAFFLYGLIVRVLLLSRYVRLGTNNFPAGRIEKELAPVRAKVVFVVAIKIEHPTIEPLARTSNDCASPTAPRFYLDSMNRRMEVVSLRLGSTWFRLEQGEMSKNGSRTPFPQRS